MTMSNVATNHATDDEQENAQGESNYKNHQEAKVIDRRELAEQQQ